MELRLHSTLRHLNAARYSELFSQSAEKRVNTISSESMENFSRQRDCANKMDGNELGRIHSMCFYVKCHRQEELAWLSASPLVPSR